MIKYFNQFLHESNSAKNEQSLLEAKFFTPKTEPIEQPMVIRPEHLAYIRENFITPDSGTASDLRNKIQSYQTIIDFIQSDYFTEIKILSNDKRTPTKEMYGYTIPFTKVIKNIKPGIKVNKDIVNPELAGAWYPNWKVVKEDLKMFKDNLIMTKKALKESLIDTGARNVFLLEAIGVNAVYLTSSVVAETAQEGLFNMLNTSYSKRIIEGPADDANTGMQFDTIKAHLNWNAILLGSIEDKGTGMEGKGSTFKAILNYLQDSGYEVYNTNFTKK